jgi:hypothetical protein
MDLRPIGAAVPLVLLAAGAPGAAPAADWPFAFAGAPLGTRLQDWRAQPYPGRANPRARPICSTDADAGRAGLAPSPADSKAGAVVCGWFARYGDAIVPEGLRPQPDRRPVQVRYVFTGGRLAEIRYHAPKDAFDKMTARLKAAYGPPRAVVRDTVSTELGRLDRVRMTWAAGADSVVLTDPDGPHLEAAIAFSSRAPSS